MNRTIIVSGRHYATFKNIFKAQGSVGWRELVSAFESINFNVEAAKGSLHKFRPPSTIPGRAFTWHKVTLLSFQKGFRLVTQCSRTLHNYDPTIYALAARDVCEEVK
ncbi:hypothetical protein BKA93DRAFT_745508 [Sparassis latifolia]